MLIYFITVFQIVPQGNSKESLKDRLENMDDPNINGMVRLTSNGTAYFKKIKDDKVQSKEFFDNLISELAKAIPVNRITTNGRHDIDTSVSPEQFIISIIKLNQMESTFNSK